MKEEILKFNEQVKEFAKIKEKITGVALIRAEEKLWATTTEDISWFNKHDWATYNWLEYEGTSVEVSYLDRHNYDCAWGMTIYLNIDEICEDESSWNKRIIKWNEKRIECECKEAHKKDQEILEKKHKEYLRLKKELNK